MAARKLPNGNLLVPRRAESEDGTIGDGVEEITPSHADYKKWLEWIEPGGRPPEYKPSS